MRQCLLCLSLLEEQLNFIDLLQLKRKENDVCQECLKLCSFENFLTLFLGLWQIHFLKDNLLEICSD